MTGAPTHRGKPTPGWRMLTGTGTGASVALGLLVLVTVFVAVVLPGVRDGLQTSALQQTLRDLPAGAATETAGIDYGDYAGFTSNNLAQRLNSTRQQVARILTADGVPVRPAAAWTELNSGALSLNGAGPGSAIGTSPLQLQLDWSDELMHYARLSAGRWPASVTRQAGTTIFQVALTPASARLFALRVGSRLSAGPGVVLAVTGIITPVDTGSAFWAQLASAATPILFSANETSYWLGGAFVGRAELPAAGAVNEQASQLSWVYPLDLRNVTGSQASTFLSTLTAAATQGAAQLTTPGSGGVGYIISSGLTPTLTSFVASQGVVDALSSLLFVSLAAVGLVVLLMGTRLVADRRRLELATMVARGATGRQLGWLVLRGEALVVLPAAAVAVGLAVAVTPGGVTALAWWLAALTTGCAITAPVLVATRSGATRRRTRLARLDRPRLLAARSVIADLTLTACAVAGLVVLEEQGLPAGGHVNVLTSAVPVLVAVPIAIVVIRLCPPVLHLARRLAGSRRGPVAFLGFARGAQAARSALLPVFALVLALAVVAFGGAVVRSINQGETAAAWQLTGADAAVGSPTGTVALPPAALHAVAAQRAVRAIAPVTEEQAQVGRYGMNGTTLSVVVVNPGQYAAVLADTPYSAFPASTLARTGTGPPPVLASPAAAAGLRGSGGLLTIGTQTFRVRIAGQLATTPAAPAGIPFVVLPLWAAEPAPLPTLFLLAGHGISLQRLTAIVAPVAPGATVTVQSVELAALRAAPLPRAAVQIYAAGAVAASLLCALIVLISLILGARSRELADARLVSMGLSGSQVQRVSALELSPFVLAAAVGGTIAAAVLAALLNPVLNLSGLTGGTQQTQLQSGILAALLTVAGLVVLTAATLFGQRATARRHAVSEALRVSQ